MEKEEEIRIETPVTISGITLVPIVKRVIYCYGVKGRLFATGAIIPFGVVVISPQEKKALLVEEGTISIEQLYEEIPGMREVLEAI